VSTQAQEPFVDDLEDGGDDIDPPLRPVGADDGDDGVSRQDTVAKDNGDWLGDADEDTRKWIQAKGWKSPADLAKSAREAESTLGRERAARTKAEQDAAELVQMMQNAQVPAGRGADDDPYQIEQLGALMEAGEVTASQAFKYLTSEVVPDLIRKEAGNLIQPVAGRVEQRDLRDTAAELEATYPDFRELSSDVISLMRSEPQEYAGSRGMKRAYAMVKADRDAKAAREARNTQRTETLDRGSIGSSVQDAEAAIRERIRGAGSRYNDGIG
jgi:hypothetical protein